MHKNKGLGRGFTIIELLVVIVVIGILAAISIVSYPRIMSLANEASMKADLSQAQKKLEIYKTQNGDYPDSNNCLIDSPQPPLICLKDLSYVRSYDKKSFGLMVSRNGINYMVSSSSPTPTLNNGSVSVIIPPSAPTVFIIGASDENGPGESRSYKDSLYFNPQPIEPVRDMNAAVASSSDGSEYDTPQFIIRVKARTDSDFPNIIIYQADISNGVNFNTKYMYLWDDIADEGVSYSKGWYKIVPDGDSEKASKINYENLPSLQNEPYVFTTWNENMNTEDLNKYCSDEPYVYFFTQS